MVATGSAIRLCTWNLLNQYHLDRRIGDANFAAWVAADPRHGVLEPYTQGLWVWRIQKAHAAELMRPLADADILFDRHKHFYPWVWTFAARVWRGDLSRQEVIQLLLEHVKKHGRVPTPPHRAHRTPEELAVTDEVAVTQWLRDWGHPAANLPEPPPPLPMTAEQTIDKVLAGPGVGSRRKRQKGF